MIINKYATKDVALHGVNKTFTNWEDLTVSAIATKNSGSKDPVFTKVSDDGAGSQGLFTYAFSSSTEEELYFSVQMPHAWKLGTALKPHTHWFGTATGAAGAKVKWGLEYSWCNNGDVFPASTIITAESTEDIVTKKQYITTLPNISGTGKTISSMLLCRVFRDITDDYAGSAALLQIDFHYEVDSLGSQIEYTKEA